MKSRYLIKFLILICCSQHGVGQNQVIDSLKQVLKTRKDDTNKVNTLNKLSENLWRNSQYDTSLVYSKSAQILAGKLNFNKGEATAYIHEGIVYENYGDYSRAMECELKALTISQEIGNKKGVAIACNNFAITYYDQGNYPKALEYSLRALAIDQEIENRKGSAYDFSIMGSTYAAQGNNPKALECYIKALTISREIGDTNGIGINLGNLGIIYYTQGNYSKGLECFFKAVEMDKKSANNRQVADDMINIGHIYADQGNSEKGLEYNFKALASSKLFSYKAGIYNCLSNIGTLYARKGNADSALKYDQEALSMAREMGNKDGIGVNLDVIGDIYKDQGNSSKALEYYFKALSIVRETGDKRFIISSYTNIGNSYINLKSYKLAKKYLDSALNVSLEISEKDEMQMIYSNMAALDSGTGNYKKALEDYKKYIICHDSMVNQESVKKITRMEVSFEYEHKEDSISTEQEKANIIKTAEIKRKSIITDSAMVISILTAILAILLINRQQIKRKKDKILFEKNLELAEKEKDFLKLEKQRTENELANAKLMLNDYIKNIVEKNELLEQFKTDVENLKKLKAREVDESRIEHIESLNRATILTEEDWNKFKLLFEKAYKGFFIRLKETLPDLTQAEIRLICLTKLKLETKQMAGILGISADTIKKSRHRLRKKLGLSEEDSIDDIVVSI